MRISTFFSSSDLPAGSMPVTNCDSSTISEMGTANASTTTMANCLGVLIKEVCSSLITESLNADAAAAPWRVTRRCGQKQDYIVESCRPRGAGLAVDAPWGGA